MPLIVYFVYYVDSRGDRTVGYGTNRYGAKKLFKYLVENKDKDVSEARFYAHDGTRIINLGLYYLGREWIAV